MNKGSIEEQSEPKSLPKEDGQLTTTDGNTLHSSEKVFKCDAALKDFTSLIVKEKRILADDFLDLMEESVNEAMALYIKHLEKFDTDPILRGYKEEIEGKYKGDLKAFKLSKLLPLRKQLMEEKLSSSFEKYCENEQVAYAELFNEICRTNLKAGYDLYELYKETIEANPRLKVVKDLNGNEFKKYFAPFELHSDMLFIEEYQGIKIYSKPSEVIGLDEEKVIKNILLIGETGCGKSTLINSMTTFLLGADRFDPRIKSVIQTKTKEINSYVIRPDPKRYDNLVRFIDTPGLGVSLDQDQRNSTAIWDYIVRYQYDLHGICFVIKSGEKGLSEMQKYIIKQVNQLFGSEIQQNLLGLFTFSTTPLPLADSSIENSGIPLSQFFNLNNAAFFPDLKGEQDFTWGMAMKNLKTFFILLSTFIPISLDQTKDVIRARNTLEATAKALQLEIDAGVKERKRLQGIYNELKKNKVNINNGTDFIYSEIYEEEIKHRKPAGEYTTNCINCHNMTCHRDCAIKDNSKKNECWAMNKDGHCRICPSKCHWTQHANLGYYTEKVKKERTLSWLETKQEYDLGYEGPITAELIYNNLTQRMNKLTEAIIININDCKANLEQLNTISLRGFNENIDDYINIMIDVERKEQSPGYIERIKQLEEIKVKFSSMDSNDLGAPNVVFDSQEVKKMAEEYVFKKNEIGQKKDEFRHNCFIY